MHHLVGPQEVAELLGISRQRLQQPADRPDFPEPVAVLAFDRVWKTEAIRAVGPVGPDASLMKRTGSSLSRR